MGFEISGFDRHSAWVADLIFYKVVLVGRLPDKEERHFERLASLGHQSGL